MSKIITAFVLTVITTAGADDITARIDRHARRVQVDGFLLEWNKATANTWDASPWTWDAAVTPDGAAGYFSTRGAEACSSWTFTIGIVGFDGNDTLFKIKIPGGPDTNNIFAFDKGGFESGGAHNLEWLVPWSAFDDGDSALILTADAVDDCGGEPLRTLLLFIDQKKSSAHSPYYYIIILIVAAAAVAACIFINLKNRNHKKTA